MFHKEFNQKSNEFFDTMEYEPTLKEFNLFIFPLVKRVARGYDTHLGMRKEGKCCKKKKK